MLFPFKLKVSFTNIDKSFSSVEFESNSIIAIHRKPKPSSFMLACAQELRSYRTTLEMLLYV